MSEITATAPILALPAELQRLLRQQLDIPSLVSLSFTCRFFRSLYDEDYFKKMCHANNLHLTGELRPVSVGREEGGMGCERGRRGCKKMSNYTVLARAAARHASVCPVCTFNPGAEGALIDVLDAATVSKGKIKLNLDVFDDVRFWDFRDFRSISCSIHDHIIDHINYYSRPATAPPVDELIISFANVKIKKRANSAVTIGDVLLQVFDHVAGLCDGEADERADRIAGKGNRYETVYSEVFDETWDSAMKRVMGRNKHYKGLAAKKKGSIEIKMLKESY